MSEKKYTIAIVDDDPFLLDMYTHKFRERDFEVLPFRESARAAERFKDDAFTPDVVLLDLMMPSINGYELLEEIKKENLLKNALLIVLSNLSEVADKKRAEALGAHGYIIKASATPNEVVNKVLEMLKH